MVFDGSQIPLRLVRDSTIVASLPKAAAKALGWWGRQDISRSQTDLQNRFKGLLSVEAKGFGATRVDIVVKDAGYDVLCCVFWV